MAGWWDSVAKKLTRSMNSYAFGLYDSLPDDAKQALLVRMTQVPAVMAPIAAGGGVLSGLAPRNEESR